MENPEGNVSNEGKSVKSKADWRSGRDDDLAAMADRSAPSSLGAIRRVNRCRVRRSGVSYCDQLENHSSVPATPTGPGQSAVAHWTLYLQYYIDAHVHKHIQIHAHMDAPVHAAAVPRTRVYVGTRDSDASGSPREGSE
ncbi:hypothetical protein ACS0PU_005205 [Formica fusca]